MKFILFLLFFINSINSHSQWQKGYHLNWIEQDEITFTSIDEAIKTPDKVKRLDLSGQNLKRIPPEISQLTNLKELYLGIIQYIGSIDKNEIQKLPNEIFSLKKLEILDLGQNKIQKIPPEINELKALKVLNLRGNPIQKLPEEVCLLENLEILDIGFTKLSRLPENFGNLSNLKRLHVDFTKIRTFPKSTINLTSLEYIHFFDDKPKNLESIIDYLSKLPNFNEIDLPILKTIPSNISKLKHLRQLNIYQHEFENFATVFKTIATIKSLKGLRLYDYGGVYELPPEIGLLKDLEFLELLFYGRLTLPEEISNLKKLKNFGFSKYIKSGIENITPNCRIY